MAEHRRFCVLSYAKRSPDKRWSYSQPDFRRRILSEQRPIPDVAPDHGRTPVARLVHDGSLTGTGDCGRGCQSGPERVPGIAAGLEFQAPSCLG